MTPADDGPVAARLREVGQEFGHGFALGLERITAALDALDRPQDRLAPVFHVAGTNGKGSTCAFLRAIFEAAGLKTHVFTSPHLIRPNERVRLAGRLVEDAAFIDALDRVARCGVTLTYFEALTAAGFLLFAETPADVVVLEVGLGGRHDATNVVRPEVSVITPVDLDHQHFLGDTIAAIAAEKAGILKAGRPGVIARQAPEALSVIAAAADAVGAPLRCAGTDWDCHAERGGLVVQTEDRLLDLPAPGLIGPHQFDNAGLAAAAALAWGDARIGDGAIAQGVASATWPARMQLLKVGPLAAAAGDASLWLDGGHNPHAGRALAATLQALAPTPTALVVGMLRAKDQAGFLAALRPMAQHAIAVPVRSSPSGLDPDALRAIAEGAGFDATVAADLETAVASARAQGARRIVICGSLYLAGEALALSGGVA